MRTFTAVGIGMVLGQVLGNGLRQWGEQRRIRNAEQALLKPFQLRGRTKEERFDELLRIAHAEGMLDEIQHDPRVQVLGFREVA